ncbi:hypothetical protein [Marinilactibacillus sp. Marseille-P9653]|uniref:hypothetical protein n=1 Tax=Marinilactibacillus sp. Marseille-P9653 TaxID=2866583 RepID=UPI001CE41F45|nr:hypothetical protein [Marinilactibacillus sp. Marseille-P9653]
MVQANQTVQKKKALLLNVFNAYETFNNTTGSATQIIDEIEEIISEMYELDRQLTDKEKKEFSDSYTEVWEEIIFKQRKLIEFIENENMAVKDQMNQVNKKNQMINGYMDQNQSMFLDRQA